MWPNPVIWTQNTTLLCALMKLHSCADFRKGASLQPLCKSNSYFTPRRICFSVWGRGETPLPQARCPARWRSRAFEQRHAVPFQYMTSVCAASSGRSPATGSSATPRQLRQTFDGGIPRYDAFKTARASRRSFDEWSFVCIRANLYVSGVKECDRNNYTFVGVIKDDLLGLRTTLRRHLSIKTATSAVTT
jgi:hypothetical protein